MHFSLLKQQLNLLTIFFSEFATICMDDRQWVALQAWRMYYRKAMQITCDGPTCIVFPTDRSSTHPGHCCGKMCVSNVSKVGD